MSSTGRRFHLVNGVGSNQRFQPTALPPLRVVSAAAKFGLYAS